MELTLTCVHEDGVRLIEAAHNVSEVSNKIMQAIHCKVEFELEWLLCFIRDRHTSDVGFINRFDIGQSSAGSTVREHHTPAEFHREAVHMKEGRAEFLHSYRNPNSSDNYCTLPNANTLADILLLI